MKKKNLVSLSVSVSFLVLSVTGLLIYFGQGAHAVEHIHAWFGILFVAAAIFHIANNWTSLQAYTRSRVNGAIQREFVIPALIAVVFAAGIGFDIPPFDQLANAGKKLFQGDKRREAGPPGDGPRAGGGGPGEEHRDGGPPEDKLSFDEINTNQQLTGTSLSLILQPGKQTTLPVMVIWVEDTQHKFVENLFVPAQIATLPEGENDVRRASFEGKLVKKSFTPASLPVWQRKATRQQTNYPNATPGDPFILTTKTSAKAPYYVVVAVQASGQTERYEAMVTPDKAAVFKLAAASHTLLDRALLEVN